MNMRKILALLAVMALLFSCAAFAEDEVPAVKTGVYTIINKTGEAITEVKQYSSTSNYQQSHDVQMGENWTSVTDSVLGVKLYKAACQISDFIRCNTARNTEYNGFPF